MRRSSLWFGSASALLLVLGCSDSEPLPAPGAPSAQVLLVDSATQAPLEGVGVAWDLKDGSRVEFVTGPDGMVPLDVDLAEVRSVVAHKLGYSFQMASGAFVAALLDAFEQRGEDPKVALAYLLNPAPEMVKVSGHAMGMQDDSNTLRVSATLPGSTMYQEKGNAMVGHLWSIEVPPAEPFTLVGVEFEQGTGASVSSRGASTNFLSWGYVQSDGVTTASSFDLGMGTSASPETANGSFAMPAHDGLISSGHASLQMRAVDDGGATFGYLGGERMIDVSMDGTTVDYQAEWIEPPDVALASVYRVYEDAVELSPDVSVSGAWSEVVVDGPPNGDPALLAPATTTLPSTGTGLHDALGWQLPEGQTHEMTQIVLWSDFAFGAMVVTGEETEVTLPALPSTSDEATVFADPVTMVVQISRCSDLPGPCDATSRDVPILLTP